MTKPFWTIRYFRNRPTCEIGVYADKVSILSDILGYEGWVDLKTSQTIGQFFLQYAYSTPAGVAYRLTYGIGKD